MKTFNNSIQEVAKSTGNRTGFGMVKFPRIVAKILAIGVFSAFAFFRIGGLTHSQTVKSSDGPTNQGNAVKPQLGSEKTGQQVFRFETFGNEGF